MTTLRQAAQQALEAMDQLHRTGDTQVFDLCHKETTEALRAALAEPVQEPASKMTAGRAVYFMERFKREEKLLGPNEQAALDFVISMLERQEKAEPVQKPPKWKLVPTEPTIGMCIAGDEARQNVDDLTRTPAIYRAMIAAAPAAQEQTEPVATFDKVWNAIDWDKWRKEPIRELVQMIHSKTSPRAAQGREPVQEPVYWEVRCTAHPKWMRVDEQQFDEYVANGWEGQRLYTDPPQRKPLTEEDIVEILCKHFECVDDEYIKRAAQEIASHNIKENT